MTWVEQTAEHDVDAATTHKRLQDAEIQRLRRAVMEKVRHYLSYLFMLDLLDSCAKCD